MTTSELLGPLIGARLRRIDLPEPRLLAATMLLETPRGERVTRVFVASFSPTLAGFGLVEARPHGAPANAFCQLLRKHLEGGVVLGVEPSGSDAASLLIRRGPDRPTLRLGAGRLELELEGRTQRLEAPNAGRLEVQWILPEAASLEALEASGARLLSTRSDHGALDEDRLLLVALGKLAEQLARRAKAVRGDLARSEDVPALRRDGTLLVSHLASIPRGAEQITLVDPHVDPPAERTIRLDPALDVRAQVTALFERARKLERGEAFSRERLAATEAGLARAHALIEALALDHASDEDRDEARELLARETRGAKAKGSRGGARGARRVERVPYRSYTGAGDREIRVGRSARDNDALTLHHAAAHDLWLHARGVTGAHVVVPLAKGEACPPALLVDAATLAAHFSDAGKERVVEVDHLPRGRVRKRKGMAPGKVEVDHPKTLALRMDGARVARLLASRGP